MRQLGTRLLETVAQDSFEYLLAVGTVVLLFVGALLAFDPVVQAIVGFVCPGVDTANGLAAVGSCITSAGP